MKRVPYFLLTLAIVVTMARVTPVGAQETASIEVAEAVICEDVVDREPVNMGTRFPASVGRLYCFTNITGAPGPVDIAHVWYFNDTERARVNLTVKSFRWRTYSSKKIQRHEIGNWRVDIEGPGGEVLKSLQFKITP